MSLDPLEHDTRLYTDMYVALRILGCPYSEYIHRTTPWERRLIMLFLLLENAKHAHADEQSEQQRQAREAARSVVPTFHGLRPH